MAYTQAQVDALRAAIAKGVTQVRNANGELVTYRTLAEMQTLLGIMEAEVAGPSRRRRRVIYPEYSRHPSCGPEGSER